MSGGINLVEEEILSFQLDKWPPAIMWSELSDFIKSFATTYVCNLFGGHIPSEGRNIWFLVCHLTLFDQAIRGTCDIYLTISIQPAMFFGHRPCHRGYITLLICHVTTHHHIARWPCDSIDGFLSPYITNLPSLVAKVLEEEWIFCF